MEGREEERRKWEKRELKETRNEKKRENQAAKWTGRGNEEEKEEFERGTRNRRKKKTEKTNKLYVEIKEGGKSGEDSSFEPE